MAYGLRFFACCICIIMWLISKGFELGTTFCLGPLGNHRVTEKLLSLKIFEFSGDTFPSDSSLPEQTKLPQAYQMEDR